MNSIVKKCMGFLTAYRIGKKFMNRYHYLWEMPYYMTNFNKMLGNKMHILLFQVKNYHFKI